MNEAAARVLDEVIAEVIAEDIVYEIFCTEGISGTYRVRQVFIDMMGLVLDRTANTMKATPVTVMSNDDDLTLWFHITGSRPDGRTYERITLVPTASGAASGTRVTRSREITPRSAPS